MTPADEGSAAARCENAGETTGDGGRSYIRADAAWYAQANQITAPEFSFAGRAPGEFCVRQKSSIALRLEAFGDGCQLLAEEYQDLVRFLAENENATGDELEEWLLAAGVEDKTPREHPAVPRHPGDFRAENPGGRFLIDSGHDGGHVVVDVETLDEGHYLNLPPGEGAVSLSPADLRRLRTWIGAHLSAIPPCPECGAEVVRDDHGPECPNREEG